MKKKVLFAALSILLFTLPWWGFTAYTILVAFVPLLMLQEQCRKRFLLWATGVFLVWNAVTAFWVSNATLFGGVAAVVANTIVAVIPFAVYHYVWKRARRALAYTALAAGWIAYEFIYLNGEFSFPWYTLGNAFAEDTYAVQWYEYTGTLGGSLWVLVCNFLIFKAIQRWQQSKVTAVAAAFAVVAPIAWSLVIYTGYEETGEKITVQTVQPNIDPYNEKFSSMTQSEQTRIILDLASLAPADVDYIITPETSIDDRIWENDLGLNGSVALLREFMATRYPDAEIIVGATTYRRYNTQPEATPTARTYSTIDFWYDFYNSALQIDSSSRVEIYHKSMLVAGAEKIPHYKHLRFLENFSLDLGGMAGQAGSDAERSVFTSMHGVKTGVAICYESIYGDYFTDYIKKGAQAMFIITNDGWWGDTPGYRNHFSYARLRAIETRRAIGRSANTGISGFINRRGDVISKTEWWEPASVTGELTLNNAITFYVKYGDMIGRVSCFVWALSLLYFIAYRTRKRNHIVD